MNELLSKLNKKEFTDFEKKAIRYICGYNTDLRIKLKEKRYKDYIYTALDKNKFGIFGVNDTLLLLRYKVNNFETYEKTLNYFANQICE